MNYQRLLEVKTAAPDWGALRLVRFRKRLYIEHERTRARPAADVDRYRAEQDIVVEGLELAPNPVLAFTESGLPDYLVEELLAEDFEAPTPVQAQGWPLLLSGHDLIGLAETGSGKTLGYMLPGIVHAMAQPLLESGEGPIVVCLCPTRELAAQVESQTVKYAQPCRLRTVRLTGGSPKQPQQIALQRGAEIVVATPGRLIDMVDGEATNLLRCTYFVLDEADKMLGMGFEHFIRKINALIRPDRQTSLFTATMPATVQHVARDVAPRAVTLRVGAAGADIALNADVQQRVFVVSEAEKPSKLLSAIAAALGSDRDSKVLVFCATKGTVETVAGRLRSSGILAHSIHSDRTQQERDDVLEAFRSGAFPVMVSTDMTSRGLDIRGVTVISYDFAPTIAAHVHRIGRAARAGRRGTAYSFFTRSSYSLAADLVGILRDTGQEVPAELQGMVPRAAPPKRRAEESAAEPPKARAKVAAAEEDEVKQPLPSSRSPSRVVLLRNLVGPGEVDAELEADVRSECCNYGRPLEVVVYEHQRWASLARVPPELAVRVFVRFGSPEEALACWRVMCGRQFGGRTVMAGFYVESRFAAGDLSPDALTDPPEPRCLLLRNMVHPQEVDEDLIPDVVTELSQYGQVERCEVSIVPDGQPYQELRKEERVRVFVLFSAFHGALDALTSLDGRMFASKEISVTLYDDVRYHAGDLLPDERSEPELPLRCLISTTQLPD